MPYFFCEENLNMGKVVSLVAEEMRHVLLSHRSRVGEKVKLQGPDKKRFLCEVFRVEKKVLELKCVQELVPPSEPKTDLILFQAVVGEKALDFIFQKGTELGLKKIILFNANNSATKLSKEKFLTKKNRWKKIITEAAKQSERGGWPELDFSENLGELQKQLVVLPSIYLTDINGGKLSLKISNKQIGIIVGPEGGFTTGEVAEFKALPNVFTLGLGSVLLRAETASISAVAGIRMVMGY